MRAVVADHAAYAVTTDAILVELRRAGACRRRRRVQVPTCESLSVHIRRQRTIPLLQHGLARVEDFVRRVGRDRVTRNRRSVPERLSCRLPVSAIAGPPGSVRPIGLANKEMPFRSDPVRGLRASDIASAAQFWIHSQHVPGRVECRSSSGSSHRPSPARARDQTSTRRTNSPWQGEVVHGALAALLCFVFVSLTSSFHL